MIALLIIVVVTLGAAAIAMALRDLIHSVLLLIGSWVGIAAFYLWAGAEFLAFAQVLVYVGAVSMVVLFAVLLTRRSRLELAIAPASRARAISAILVAGSMLAVLAFAVLSGEFQPSRAAGPDLTVHQLGTRLMGTHAAALLVVGVILTVALLGAVVIAATDPREETETDS